MEGLNTTPQPEKKEKIERERDPMLELLWEEYDFPGKPPFLGSAAEKRLKQSCDMYATRLDTNHKVTNVKGAKFSDAEQRRLHNEIALMVVGEQRSGMKMSVAEHIANFAYEYSRGYKMEEADKFKDY